MRRSSCIALHERVPDAKITAATCRCDKVDFCPLYPSRHSIHYSLYLQIGFDSRPTTYLMNCTTGVLSDACICV
jgi:hypothetical protein